eukprot:CAMPEP_0195071272 /NCGR_PEP_ID=MMETSP0448-20130528/15130_1 /TAXON_ID=66468 /ORGANISM="Heterocapsa triquestra, Strain CCMP 448" /LENGTH=55 /DNA_ID=CAMNT_0040103103 /DNA_START=9 /DNA_END=173 /DNA_ORIENTATION=+
MTDLPTMKAISSDDWDLIAQAFASSSIPKSAVTSMDLPDPKSAARAKTMTDLPTM